jgi:phytoene dehydrogenase-like protein
LVSSSFDAIIVGAGHNGLVTAGYLSREGLKVLVLERRDIIGGACVTEELFKGYQVSSCSYVCHLLQTKVVNDLELKKFGFQVSYLEPRRFGPFSNSHKYMLLWHDTEKTKAEIQRVSKADSRSYKKWMDFWVKAARTIHYFFLLPPPSEEELLSKARELGVKDVLERVLTSTLRDLLEEFFESEEIRGYFCNVGQDLGDPDAVGGPLAAAYFYCNEFTATENYGVVRGGMGGIVRALASSAEHHGATILKNAEVKRILVRDGKATGVKLEDGREFTSKIVVSNADPKRTFLRLVEPDSLEPSFVKSVNSLKTNIAYMKFHCTLKELPDFSSYLGNNPDPTLLAQIRITHTVDAQKRAWDEVQK